MNREFTTEERSRFARAYGQFYGGVGGLFSPFNGARDAFEKAIIAKPYESFKFVDSDFEAFEEGFNEIHEMRTAIFKVKGQAQETMKRLCNLVQFESPVKVKHYTELEGWKADNAKI